MAHLSVYGNTSINKGFCQSCRTHAFVKNGALECCGEPYDKIPDKYKIECSAEHARRLPGKKKRKQKLMEQNNSCFYCEKSFDSWIRKKGKLVKLRIEWDHFVPYSYSFNNKEANFVAACHICNGLKSNKFFDTIEQAKSYIAAKSENDLQKLP